MFRYLRDYVDSGHKIQNKPLTEEQDRSLKLLDEILSEENIVVSYDLKKFDMTFFNNHRVIHGRTSFEDFEDEEKKRLRSLIVVNDPSRTLGVIQKAWQPAFKKIYGQIDIFVIFGMIVFNQNLYVKKNSPSEVNIDFHKVSSLPLRTLGRPIEEIVMRVRHIRSLDIWLMSKGNRVLYRGKENPWRSTRIMQSALRREGVRSAA